MRDSIWVLRPKDEHAKTLALELGIPLEIAQILINRDISEVQDVQHFLFGSLDSLNDPYLMKGMKEAVNRIKKAISGKERLLIFGDYDVDGILSVVALTKALRSLGADVEHFIPDRLKQGYGMKGKYIDRILAKKTSLVISVDCGIKAVDFVNRAKQYGVDVIITDHHQPGPVLPEALAVLNPVVGSSGYPDRALAGIGVVFKLIQALLESEGKSAQLRHYLKLVSIGTIADVAALKGENRLFVKFGLKELENVNNIGLKSLIEVCGLLGKRITVGDVGFRIGPRINAAGRLGLTDLAVQLFFSESVTESEEMVGQLDKLNAERQKIEKKIFQQSMRLVEDRRLHEKYKLLILGCEEWHRGVIGIVASKLKDTFHQPVILFSYKDEKASGSGRSIPEFPLIDCLDETSRFLLTYGGHVLAVGCELLREDMDAFRMAANAFAESRLTEDDFKKKIKIDVKLNFNNIEIRFLDNLQLLSPFGVGNPKPIFLTEMAEVVAQPKTLNGKHSKFILRQNGKMFEAVGWGRSDWAKHVRRGDLIDLVYSLQFSHYLGDERLSLSLEDIKIQ
ncbi:MAG: single-stranded-DNA-specific exonuclease RecJ [Candidatus Aminicenantes bacterium]|jgi:single-stranded-DNA-specific exonuclease